MIAMPIQIDLKQKMRQEIRRLRDSMTDAPRKSAEISKKLENLAEYKRAKTVLFYASKDNEVGTKALIENAISSGKVALLPITNMRSKELEVGQVTKYDDLRKGEFGILEPKTKATEMKIDAAVVPGIAFDGSGHRLGYGLGFYDKLLARLEATKIGLAYAFQIVEAVPKQNHDQKMDYIVTEEKVIEC